MSVIQPLTEGEAYGDVVDRTGYVYDDPTFGYSAWAPSTTRSDRIDGHFWPHYRTEIDLALIRMRGRRLSAITRIHTGAVDALANYTFGNGFEFNAQCEENPTIAAEVQRIVDEFLDDHQFAGDFDRETHARSREDGEAFIHLVPYRGKVCAKFIESDNILQPFAPSKVEDYEDLAPGGSWTYGIHTWDGDSANVQGFYLQNGLAADDWEYAPVERLTHLKRNVTRNAKRGLSDFYGIDTWIMDVAKLERNSVRGAALQAAIPWIEQMPPGTSAASASSIGGSTAIGQMKVPQLGDGYQTRTQATYVPGTVLRVPSGREFKPGPLGAERNAGFEIIAQQILKRIGQRWNMPEYMISGDASNANYASSMVAESPFVKARQADQQWYGTRFVSMLWKVVRMYWEQGRFERFAISWDQLRHFVKLSATYPTVETRDTLKLAQTQQILQSMGVISDKTIATQQGLDFEEEQRLGAAKPAPPPAPMVPGMVPQHPVTDPEQQSREQLGRLMAGGRSPVPESLQEAEGNPNHDPHSGQFTTSAGGKSVAFTNHPYHAKGETTVMVHADKLDKAWSGKVQPPGSYIGPTDAGIEGRREAFGKFLDTGKPVEASLLHVDDKGGVAFRDGRHRFAVLRDMGAKEMAVTVPMSALKRMGDMLVNPADIGDAASELAIGAREKLRKVTGLGRGRAGVSESIQEAVEAALESVTTSAEARAVLSQLVESESDEHG